MDGETERAAEIQNGRVRVLEAAAKLIVEGGVAALTTRAVASAASMQVPTLYRLFGEKRGLLNAVAQHGLAAFVAQKVSAEPHSDPVQDLRDAWDDYVAFGLANPAVFAIINEIGVPGPASPAALAGIEVLRKRVKRIARAGRLGVPVERAVALIHAAGVGTVTTLLATSSVELDPQLAASAREAVMAAILADIPKGQDRSSIASLAIALEVQLGRIEALTPGERLLLSELLDRLSSAG
ncbi:TetR/AcrR family transcriptional regulator [Sphingomonas abietis]|uniref:Helix-turn-helix domain containing protein n=1 Tax=Sphingomonas abietis TaxID=3012344 RepID=A0ABY7NNW9_9SPHN|nr:helix-turn-helix domain-containing protein [Sphingomonas abietis]WBO22907.1 helix-turn-helix domain containing protein [Sphingomonas abietis]